ncbi:plasmid recombination protein [Coprobacter tertius]
MQNTFGKENVVSTVLHLDEKTSHIHETVVPIVSGEGRKAVKEKR